MKKLSLYIFLVLMFCNTAQAVPIHNLIGGVIITILGAGAANIFNIDPLFFFSIFYGVIFILSVIIIIFWFRTPTSSIKNKKQELREIFQEMSFIYIFFILVLGGLLIFR